MVVGMNLVGLRTDDPSLGTPMAPHAVAVSLPETRAPVAVTTDCQPDKWESCSSGRISQDISLSFHVRIAHALPTWSKVTVHESHSCLCSTSCTYCSCQVVGLKAGIPVQETLTFLGEKNLIHESGVSLIPCGRMPQAEAQVLLKIVGLVVLQQVAA